MDPLPHTDPPYSAYLPVCTTMRAHITGERQSPLVVDCLDSEGGARWLRSVTQHLVI